MLFGERLFFISLVLKCSRIQYRSKVTRRVHKNRYFTEQKILYYQLYFIYIFLLFYALIARRN